uniref:Peptidylprolyl isomerase n=1 Tax=Entomoneis paludosa TaxID=265537 RepID=A0A7S2Y431_9STRA|mmetsp:Transcript_16030/g.33148  ORF Transcript_16030/g.33148 Transcript_16030/m.33148 type:complete len:174 (+) Transcript_16030:118-639(+)|eukprot:CAMPEP_0172471360 /NCGR_PEP_ID=MMETSP1065-20121228/67777_1 /TAXON_ID=265537 /ORGANISM="Amphiprora paludosa, Strain CCMP125" /LENGTH=173 /DNA_ID=CAMNT_0013229455 /DNA_START=88 /DNA_END=609 /DNA_ORIENTATION=-
MRFFRVLLNSTALLAIFALQGATSLSPASIQAPKKVYGGGAGVGRLVVDESIANKDSVECHYDMVYVERLQGKAKADSGLFIPDEDLPKLLLCRVLSIGPGREEENGRIAPMPDIKVGDVVLAKNPWGIGPKDEETASGRFFSYMRSQDITAVITGGLVEEPQEEAVDEGDAP